MLVIHKQSLQAGLNHLSLPIGAELLHAAIQRDAVMVWYLRPVVAPGMEDRVLLLVGTGNSIDDPPAGKVWKFISTMLTPDHVFVFHVFELVSTDRRQPTGEQLVEEEGR